MFSVLIYFSFYVLSYVIAQGVCYLILCEASFPKKMAFAYLEDLHAEFFDQYGRKVPTVTRPYSFIEFGETAGDPETVKRLYPNANVVPFSDTYIQKNKKAYIDSRARRNLGSINTELQDVQRIMVANIEEVLQRGEALSGKSDTAEQLHRFMDQIIYISTFSFSALDTKASNLSTLSKKYRSDAKYLNTRSTYAKVAAVAVVFITLIIYVRFWWL